MSGGGAKTNDQAAILLPTALPLETKKEQEQNPRLGGNVTFSLLSPRNGTKKKR